ncbi:hypothetical protein [Lagierella massiliensis]|uniref:hypothetical protein n=1 Tax=Lagierella massiliensis TaxID=1689303 RepID=UPI0006D81398|nr:hypothetical protein [Lagierella massiliensis]
MIKEEFGDVVLKKVDEKSKEIEMNFARYKETENPDFLRICTEAKGFNDGIEWILKKVQEIDYV